MTTFPCPHCGEQLELRRKSNGGKTNPAPREQILALKAFGATNPEIAHLYGISRQRVANIIAADAGRQK